MKVNDIAYCMIVGRNNKWIPEKCRIIGIINNRPYQEPDYQIRTAKGRFRVAARYLYPDLQSCQDQCKNLNEFLLSSPL